MAASKLELALVSVPGEGFEVWQLRSGTQLKHVAVEGIEDVVLLDEQHVLVTTQRRPGVQIWSWRSGQQKAKCSFAEKTSAMAVSKDRRHLACGTASGKLFVWDLRSGRLVRGWEGHYKAVTCLDFTSDDALLVSGAEDSVVCVWDFCEVLCSTRNASEAPTPHTQFTTHSLSVTGLCCGVGGAGGRVVTCSLDRTVRVFDLPSKSLVASFLCPSFLSALAVAPDEGRVFAGAGDGNVYVIDLDTARFADGEAGVPVPVTVFMRGQRSVASVSTSYDGSLVLVGSEDGMVRVRDASSRQMLKTFDSQNPRCGRVVVFQDFLGFFELVGAKATRPVPSLDKYFSETPATVTVRLPPTAQLQLVGGAEESDDGDDVKKRKSAQSSPVAKRQKKRKTTDREDGEEEEVIRLSEGGAQHWKKVSDRLFEYCVDNILAKE